MNNPQKVVITIETEADRSVIETMRRTGFKVGKDGRGMQLLVANCSIPGRSTKISFNDVVGG